MSALFGLSKLPRRILRVLPVMASILLCGNVVAAQELPPLPPSLLNTSGAVCIKVSQSGRVAGAFIIVSTGDAQRDRDLLTWVQQLRWAKAEPGEKLRDTWFPMPVAIGNGELPAMPESCAPGSKA